MKKEKLDDCESPSRDNTSRFSSDALLRRNGFKIVDRPKNGVAIWFRHGEEFTEREALNLIFLSRKSDTIAEK